MKTATVRTVREFCGLSCQDIADRFDITLRTVQRWEAVKFEDSTIRPEVRDWLFGLVDWMNATADTVLDFVEEHEAPVDLSRFINATSAEAAGLVEVPWQTHAACQGYIFALLRSMEIDCEVHYTLKG